MFLREIINVTDNKTEDIKTPGKRNEKRFKMIDYPLSGLSLSQLPPLVILSMVFIGIWTIIWQGIALWHSAQNQQKNWFMALLILNTLGLLPIIYLLWFKPKEITKKKKAKH